MGSSNKTANHARRLFSHMLRSVQSSAPQATARIKIDTMSNNRCSHDVGVRESSLSAPLQTRPDRHP